MPLGSIDMFIEQLTKEKFSLFLNNISLPSRPNILRSLKGMELFKALTVKLSLAGIGATKKLLTEEN